MVGNVLRGKQDIHWLIAESAAIVRVVLPVWVVDIGGEMSVAMY